MKTLPLHEMEMKAKTNRFKMIKSMHKQKPNNFNDGKQSQTHLWRSLLPATMKDKLLGRNN